MPNLLPDWALTLPWDLGEIHLRAAGRLFWSSVLLVIGLAFVVALIKPPVLKRPFPTAVGIALFPAIVIGGLVAGKLLPSIQRGIVWLWLLALVGHAFLMVISRVPREPKRSATWVECFTGAVAVFALMTVAYAIVPHEWLDYANKGLNWGDNTKFIFNSHEPILGIGGLPNYPFNFDFPALRDIVVTLIYGAVLTANLVLFVRWQQRFDVKPAAAEAPMRRSRFGRPLRAKA
jgi:hypothetical protein